MYQIKEAGKARPVRRRPRAYPSRRSLSRKFHRRAVAAPPRTRCSDAGLQGRNVCSKRPKNFDSLPLGLLLLALQGCQLRPRQERRAWGLVERWTA